MKRNAGKADDTPSAKRRDLDSFIKEEEAKVTTAKARGLRTEQDLPNHLNVTPTERPTLALTDEDIHLDIDRIHAHGSEGIQIRFRQRGSPACETPLPSCADRHSEGNYYRWISC